MTFTIKMARRLAQRLINQKGTPISYVKDGKTKYACIGKDNKCKLKDMLEQYESLRVYERGFYYEIAED